MHLEYNGYQHAENEVAVDINCRLIYAATGARLKYRWAWTITGVLLAADEAALSAKMGALQTAYSTNGGDLKLYGNTGSLTQHFLISGGTINGVQVQGFHWLPGNPGIWGMSTEYVNKRTYRVTLAAEVLAAESNLVSYQSSITVIGTGGPKIRYAPSLLGFPQQQTLQARTTQKVMQAGMVVGLTSAIAEDPPLYPAYELVDSRRIVRGSPLNLGINLSTNYPTRWSYLFEAPTAIA